MAAYTSVYIIQVIFYLHDCFALFIEGTARLPRNVWQLAVGYNARNDTVLLFGGATYKRQFIQFRENEFIDIDVNYLSEAQQTKGMGSHYTQIEDELWVIKETGAGFITIDTQTYVVSEPLISIPTTVSFEACLSSVPGYLFVIGGYYMKNTQIYSISSGNWLSNTPTLNSERAATSCLVVNDRLYVIGGYDATSNAFLKTIEVLEVSIASMLAITTQVWNVMSNTLQSNRESTRSIAHGTDIYVIGGWNNYGVLDDVNVIDTLSGDISVIDYLAFATMHASPIILDDTLYVFGGYIDPAGTTKYQYKILPSLQTNSPSKDPNLSPTNNPSSLPSQIQSFAPTMKPTFSPTNNPNLLPSIIPSFAPTMKPTVSPTNNPDSSPSIILSLDITTQPETTVNNIQITRKLTTLQYTQAKSTNNEDSNEQNNGNPPNNKEVNWRLYIRIFVIVSLLAMFCFAVLYLVKRKMNTQKNKEIEDNAVLEMRGKQSIVLVDEDDVCVAQAKLTIGKKVKVHKVKLDDDQQEGFEKHNVNDEQQLTIEGYNDEQQAVVDTNETTKGVMVDEQDVYTRGALDI